MNQYLPKLVLITLLALLSLFLLGGCNSVAKNWGGSVEVKLSTGKKLVNVTWKDSSFWYLTRDRRAGEPIENYTFQEESNFGLVQGTVTIKEQ